jgi:hypothetical protein
MSIMSIPLKVSSAKIFMAVDKARSGGQLGQRITQGRAYFEASLMVTDLLDRVTSDGQHETGRFENGVFVVG